jgi:hypothetical protein
MPQSMEAQHSPPSLTTSKPSLPSLKSKNTRFPTEGWKAINCYSAGGTRSLNSPRYIEAQSFTLCSLKPVWEIRPQISHCPQVWLSPAKPAAMPLNCTP